MENKKDYININGTNLYFDVSGNPKGTPLVMLHGGLGSMDELNSISPYVATNYQVIRVDFRGHGKSLLGEQPLSYLQYQKDIQALLNHLDVGQYSIFGFSDGGIVAYRLAASQPERVNCLVTLGAQWRLKPNDPSIELLSGLNEEDWLSQFADEVTYYEENNPEPNFSKLLHTVKGVWLDTTASGYPDIAVKTIKCPTLVMRGDNDFLFSLDEAVALKASITNCSFANIPLTAHSSHQESPKLVGEMLRQFLRKHTN
ncbi:alpha/beta fold hydrolase [Pseudoalteromonas luteoviolacea]|uniref:AB hydrolase-1 domain-containing protein n=1 Tax=Pseudoalteromonas luteoviolacea H33 TaxID=1365251 RepID=A0A167AWL8_9GAMM|nr:alpha/beta hydrolase [Pseudoalteromonas luteoviolacea]KZN45889.1 hypothetical protein N476_24785 [Pseudoalteromonas luteoviolacea H33]KZN76899.1 hypothetical protein N477_14075 [Pseudoalteromonas luteoviolacea H33-S]MBQ4879024.1 alpha/beta hydrolase [Pseudoalteromonas luteoviolacea]MBQ4908025.1 alpha/beta hydrolase [Pseudoalteromonas luteoviolacea]